MLRVDWQGEADKACEESLAIQAANRHEQEPELISDLQEALNGDSDSNPAHPSIPGTYEEHYSFSCLDCVTGFQS